MRKKLFYNGNTIVRGRRIFNTIYGEQISPKPKNHIWVTTAIQKGTLKTTFPYGKDKDMFCEDKDRVPAVFSLIEKMGYSDDIIRELKNNV
jgi:hypothetical protein